MRTRSLVSNEEATFERHRSFGATLGTPETFLRATRPRVGLPGRAFVSRHWATAPVRVRQTPVQRSGQHNRLLQLVPREPHDAVCRHLASVTFEAGRVVADPEQPLRHAYVPESRVGSIVSGSETRDIHVGTAGNDGSVGLSGCADDEPRRRAIGALYTLAY